MPDVIELATEAVEGVGDPSTPLWVIDSDIRDLHDLVATPGGVGLGVLSPAGGHVPDVLVALLALLVGRHVGTIRWRVVTQEDQAAGGIGVQADPLGADRPLEVVQEEIPLDPPWNSAPRAIRRRRG